MADDDILGPGQQPSQVSNTTTQTTTSAPDVLSNGDLPWAQVLLPTTSSGVGGVGVNQHQLQVGSWVFGFFADGDSCQQPVIVGTYAGGLGAATGGAGPAGAGGASPDLPVTGSQGGSNVDTVYRKLRELGYSHVQTVGIMGNLQVESTVNINPGSNNPNDKGAQSYGIAQWQKSRLVMLRQYAAQKGRPVNDLNLQLEFLDYEMKNFPSTTGFASRHLQNARTPEEAAAAFVNFEKPEGWRNVKGGGDGSAGVLTLRLRQQYAKNLDSRFKNSGTPSPQMGPR